jgi:glycosyltransferase involved in cell wall biosynthesis
MLYINSRFLTQPITGVQRFAIEIAKQLKKLYGDEVVFVSPNGILHQDIAKDLDVEIIGKRTGHFWEQLDLPQYLKKQGSPLLLNLANTAPVFYRNKIVTIHDVAFNIYPQTYSKTFLFSYKILIPNIIKTSKLVITVSNFSKQEISRFYHVANENISIVYNAVNEDFKPVLVPDLQEENYFLAVSSLNYRKNLVSVLQAFDAVSTQNESIKLYLIGDLDTKSFTKIDIDKYLRNPRIRILGRVTDSELVKYYTNARGFLYPSLYEGFGIPPLEAQACGCPVLVSNTSCLPEVFNDSALYCDPFSIDSIKSGMLSLLDEDTRKSLQIRGQENVKRFSWEQSALNISNILLKM